ncbi:MAG TPA: hypothetical protein VK796_12355 [Cytophaga sp.]|jgi:hypothetical protein|nr:hypothetical protein [Cytophaga sp.]
MSKIKKGKLKADKNLKKEKRITEAMRKYWLGETENFPIIK